MVSLARLVSPLLPFVEIRTFHPEERDAAMTWVSAVPVQPVSHAEPIADLRKRMRSVRERAWRGLPDHLFLSPGRLAVGEQVRSGVSALLRWIKPVAAKLAIKGNALYWRLA